MQAVLKDLTDAQIKVRKTTLGTRSWNNAVYGRDKRHRLKSKLKNGIDTGLRHCKKRLANKLLRLEQIAEQEGRWDMRFGETSFIHEFFASTALAKQWREFSEGKCTIVDDGNQAFMRDRGRKQQIASNSDYPAVQDESKETVRDFVQNPGTGRLYTKVELTVSGRDGRTGDADRLAFEAQSTALQRKSLLPPGSPGQ